MRAILIGFVTVVAVMSVSAEPSSAQTRRWCTERGVGSFGFPTCAYDTQAQCLASASGNGLRCTENPEYVPPAKAKSKKKRRN